MFKDTNSYNILLLEDNPGDALLIADYLEEEIISPIIHTAGSFEKGASILKEKLDELDIILLDLSLPDLEGEALIKEIMAISDGIPIIILTGYTNIEFAVKAISMGASDYLLKDTMNGPVLHKSIVYNIERNKYLLQIKESEQRYADLFHFSPLPMWVYDLQSLNFLDVNEAAIRHYGYSYNEFLDLSILDIRPEEEIHKVKSAVAESKEKNKSFSQGEYLHRKKDGTEIIVDIQSNTIPYKGGKARIVLATDITERHKHIQAIEKQNKKLREIAWTQSHVVRAPLSRIMGLIQLLELDAARPGENKKILENIQISARELDDIIREIVRLTEHFEIDKK